MRVVVETQEGQIFECQICNLRMNRHKVASINIRSRFLKSRRRGRGKPGCGGFPTALYQRNL